MSSRSKQGFSTKIWGSGGIWLFLHVVSLNFPCRPTQQERRQYYTFIRMLQYVLPCKACRLSTAKFYRQGSTKLSMSVFKSRDTLALWVWRLHNRVNRRLGKRCGLSFRQMCAKYESFRADCDAKKHGCEAKKGQPKRRAVVVIMHEDEYDRLRLKSSVVDFADIRKRI